MGIYAEFLILYIVIFISGSAGLHSFIPGEASGFSVFSELLKIFLYFIPSTALIWHLALKVKPVKFWDINPGKKDFISAFITFPCLLIIGFTVTFVSSFTGSAPAQAVMYLPSSVIEWAALSVSCICAAYLEESFFRFYILSRREEINLRAIPAAVISTAVFSICHIYEGPWGFLNSILSGIFLCMIFLKYRAFHGISIAHALYNLTVYVLTAMMINRAV